MQTVAKRGGDPQQQQSQPQSQQQSQPQSQQKSQEQSPPAATLQKQLAPSWFYTQLLVQLCWRSITRITSYSLTDTLTIDPNPDARLAMSRRKAWHEFSSRRWPCAVPSRGQGAPENGSCGQKRECTTGDVCHTRYQVRIEYVKHATAYLSK